MFRRIAVIGAVLAAGGVPAFAASPAVTALETGVQVSAAATSMQLPAADNSTVLGAWGIGASVLMPAASTDDYAALSYSAGLQSPNDNSLELKLGLGLPLANGLEAIPYLAGGYQTWHRSSAGNGYPGGVTLHSGLFGVGARLDIPVTSSLAAYGSGEFLALAGSGLGSTPPGVSTSGTGFGVTPEERLELGVDEALPGPVHLFAQTYWTHLNYTGSESGAGQGAYQPFSATTQAGVALGLGYSF